LILPETTETFDELVGEVLRIYVEVDNSILKEKLHKLLDKFKHNITAEFMHHITWCGKAG